MGDASDHVVPGTIASRKLSQTVHLNKSAAEVSFITAGKSNSPNHAVNCFSANTDTCIRIEIVPFNSTV